MLDIIDKYPAFLLQHSLPLCISYNSSHIIGHYVEEGHAVAMATASKYTFLQPRVPSEYG